MVLFLHVEVLSQMPSFLFHMEEGWRESIVLGIFAWCMSPERSSALSYLQTSSPLEVCLTFPLLLINNFSSPSLTEIRLCAFSWHLAIFMTKLWQRTELWNLNWCKTLYPLKGHDGEWPFRSKAFPRLSGPHIFNQTEEIWKTSTGNIHIVSP